MTDALSFSIVICSDARLDFLKNTIESLDFIKYSNFEVCVVCGPSEDGSHEFIRQYGKGIKGARCGDRNLSQARNIGIAMSAGDVVAFLDDDAIPEPEWLHDLAESYHDSEIGAVGGFVYDDTGVSFQAKFVTTNRLGYANKLCDAPAGHLNFPFSPEYPHLLGTNCSFRRSVLLELGGFDEEFDYFLDETDLCCRVNDAGYKIDQRTDAFVHHKYAPSPLRDARRVVTHWYPLIKNRVYFGMRNGKWHHSVPAIISAGMNDVTGWDRAIQGAVAAGLQEPADLERFRSQAKAAISQGLLSGQNPKRKLLSRDLLDAHISVFVRFHTRLPLEERQVICLVTQDFPPRQNGGIARNISVLARSLAEVGHHVHVLTKSSDTATTDFEDGVWIHRLEIEHFAPPQPTPISPLEIPSHIWGYSQTMLKGVKLINTRQRVNLVYVPLWDCEPIAFIMDATFPVVCALQTTMRFWLDSQPQKFLDREWMHRFGNPIIALEQFIIGRATLLHANSRAIVADIKRRYDIPIDENRVFTSPHGAEDWLMLEPSQTPDRTDGKVRLLFVGRLEARKGIDVLLAVAPEVLRRFPDVTLDIVGDDTIQRADGSTYKDLFLASMGNACWSNRIVFHGRVEENELRGFYRSCDILIAPSRYESFGLVYLEAMIFAKPVIGGSGGGGGEVIANGRTGILVDADDAKGLQHAIERLIKDRDLRVSMGQAGRADYEAKFTNQAMRDDMLRVFTTLTQKEPPPSSRLYAST